MPPVQLHTRRGYVFYGRHPSWTRTAPLLRVVVVRLVTSPLYVYSSLSSVRFIVVVGNSNWTTIQTKLSIHTHSFVGHTVDATGSRSSQTTLELRATHSKVFRNVIRHLMYRHPHVEELLMGLFKFHNFCRPGQVLLDTTNDRCSNCK